MAVRLDMFYASKLDFDERIIVLLEPHWLI
jgi:hypothetical protein